jgi:hypothetical protein
MLKELEVLRIYSATTRSGALSPNKSLRRTLAPPPILLPQKEASPQMPLNPGVGRQNRYLRFDLRD